MRKILLLNPPGKKLYIRYYHCSTVSKGNYVPPPTDLVFLSGILSKDYDIELLDAIVGKLDDEKCLRKILKMNPDVIISLAGAVSWDEDIQFFKKLKHSSNCHLILTGDLFFKGGEQKLKEYSFIDAIFLNFTTKDVLYYLSKDYKKLKNMIYRYKGKIISAPLKDIRGEFSIPVPKHELFVKYKYRFPFIKDYPMAVILTDYSCPHKCGFCIMSILGFKYRNLNNVLQEIKYVKSLGVKDLYFHDQTFGATRIRTLELCKRMVKEKLNMRWCCFSRVDVVDYELLCWMKKAGCHTIMFGVESADEKILKTYKKGYSLKQIRKAFKLTKKVGVKTMGTFLIGLPEDDINSCLKTIDLSKELGCDYASFNFAVPRGNTELKNKAIKKGLITEDTWKMDQAGTQIAMPTYNLSKKDIQRLRRKALVSFYLRPTYIAKRFLSINSYAEFKIQINEAWGMLKSLI